MDNHVSLTKTQKLDIDKLRFFIIVLSASLPILFFSTLPHGYAHEGMTEKEYVTQTKQGILGNPNLDEIDKVIKESKSAKWNSVELIEILFDEHYYEPDYLELSEGKNYRLIMKNIGERRHDMVGHDLFSTLAIHEVHGPFGSISTPHIDRILLDPGQQIEVRVTPTKAGSFPMVCTISGHHDDGMEGDIVINKR